MAKKKRQVRPESERARVVSSGLPGTGEVKETFAIDGARALGVAMLVEVYGGRRTSRKGHLVPASRVHLLKKGKKLPVKVAEMNFP